MKTANFFFHLHWFLFVWFNGNWPFSCPFFEFFFFWLFPQHEYALSWLSSIHWSESVYMYVNIGLVSWPQRKLKSKMLCHSLTLCKMAICHWGLICMLNIGLNLVKDFQSYSKRSFQSLRLAFVWFAECRAL